MRKTVHADTHDVRTQRLRMRFLSVLMLPALLLTLSSCATQAPEPAVAETGLPGTAAVTPQATPEEADYRQVRSEAERGNPAALDVLATLHYRGIGVDVDYLKARTLMERAVARNYLPAINNLAWLLATCPDRNVRDGVRAIALLEPAMDQSAQMQDTLAAAYAETGNFESARTFQKQAILALDNAEDSRLPEFVERLTAYANDSPWRDPAEHAQ